MMALLTKRVPGRGWHPAKRAEDLVAGDVVLRAHRGAARVSEARVGDKVVHLRLAGVEHPWSLNIWKRRRSLVAVDERRPRARIRGVHQKKEG